MLITFEDSVIAAADCNGDELLSPAQVCRLLKMHGASLADMLSEIPAEDGEVWRSPEFVLSWLGY